MTAGAVRTIERASVDVVERLSGWRERHQRQIERVRESDRVRVIARDKRCASFGVQAGREAVAHRHHATTNTRTGFQNSDGVPELLQRVRRAQSRQAGAEDHDVLRIGGAAER